VQDVFVEAYFGLAGYRADAPFEFWLNKIATRIGYRFWKSRAAKTSVTIQPLSEVQIQSIATGETNELSPSEAGELVHRMLAELPPADRLVLTLISIEERTIAEAALLTGWNQTLVKVRAYRARRKLEGIWKRIESQNRGTLR
ncbi:MAG: RNA polymerase sigma factor, partial [Planctomycetes bacterium]|nr:RNA polymerase sigma factor [Planctomycetota bacterium]